MRVDRKRKKEALDICKGILDIECERDWSVSLGATLDDADRKLNTIFLVSGIFPGKADSVILLVFECTICPQNLIKIIGAIFKENKKLFFFSCELPLILGVGGKLKNAARDIYKRTLDIEFQRDRSIGLGSTIGDGQTDTDIFSKTHF